MPACPQAAAAAAADILSVNPFVTAAVTHSALVPYNRRHAY